MSNLRSENLLGAVGDSLLLACGKFSQNDVIEREKFGGGETAAGEAWISKEKTLLLRVAITLFRIHIVADFLVPLIILRLAGTFQCKTGKICCYWKKIIYIVEKLRKSRPCFHTSVHWVFFILFFFVFVLFRFIFVFFLVFFYK